MIQRLVTHEQQNARRFALAECMEGWIELVHVQIKRQTMRSTEIQISVFQKWIL